VEIIIELPAFSKKTIDKFAEKLKERNFDVFVPENPAGRPALLAAVTGTYLRTKYELGVYVSLRLLDVNLLHAYSAVLTAREFGVKGVTILKGDKPIFGENLKADSEETLTFLKSRIEGVNLGLVVSLRYPVEEISGRLAKRPDYIMVIHYGSKTADKLEQVAQIARRLGVKVYPFMLIGYEKSREVFTQLNQPFIEPMELKEKCASLSNRVNGIVFSSPLDLQRAIDDVYKLCS
jgi:5,10-methylenetetrahydrofolate reductase